MFTSLCLLLFSGSSYCTQPGQPPSTILNTRISQGATTLVLQGQYLGAHDIGAVTVTTHCEVMVATLGYSMDQPVTGNIWFIECFQSQLMNVWFLWEVQTYIQQTCHPKSPSTWLRWMDKQPMVQTNSFGQETSNKPDVSSKWIIQSCNHHSTMLTVCVTICSYPKTSLTILLLKEIVRIWNTMLWHWGLFACTEIKDHPAWSENNKSLEEGICQTLDLQPAGLLTWLWSQCIYD